jgi:hypothetical protein
MRKIIIALIVLILFPVLLHAYGTCGTSAGCPTTSGQTEWTAASTSYADVNYCVNTCAARGDTVHHLTGISMNASSTAYIEVLCQDTQGVESSNLEIPITTDAQKTFTIGAGSQTLTIGTGSNTLTILP